MNKANDHLCALKYEFEKRKMTFLKECFKTIEPHELVVFGLSTREIDVMEAMPNIASIGCECLHTLAHFRRFLGIFTPFVDVPQVVAIFRELSASDLERGGIL